MTSTPSSEAAGHRDVQRTIEAVWRIDSARIIGTLTRQVGDFARAEDLAQAALVEALELWPARGVPRNPAAWLTTVAKRRAIDQFRREARLEQHHADLAHGLAQADATDPEPGEVTDDVLRLIFISTHPVLAPQARIALTLRVVAGLTTEQLSVALLAPVATIQQRITRAKKTLRAAGVPFALPPPQEYTERLGSVLNVLYLIFNEGYVSTTGDAWLRRDLAREGLRLARIVAALVPSRPETHALVALMELHSSRFAARETARGEPILLGDQDRSQWDRSAIGRGLAALARSDALGRGRGPYALQAAIARCHALAPSVEETDWDTIIVLYEALGRVAPSPVVTLNRAVAVSMAHGPAAALALVDEVCQDSTLAGHYLLPSVRGDLLARLGRGPEAAVELRHAAELTSNTRERAVLLARADALSDSAD